MQIMPMRWPCSSKRKNSSVRTPRATIGMSLRPINPHEDMDLKLSITVRLVQRIEATVDTSLQSSVQRAQANSMEGRPILVKTMVYHHMPKQLAALSILHSKARRQLTRLTRLTGPIHLWIVASREAIMDMDGGHL